MFAAVRADKSNEDRGVTVVGFAKARTALPCGGRRLCVVLDRKSAMDADLSRASEAFALASTRRFNQPKHRRFAQKCR
jgi:hypothetical protein